MPAGCIIFKLFFCDVVLVNKKKSYTEAASESCPSLYHVTKFVMVHVQIIDSLR